MKPPQLPRAFQSLGALRLLNIGAVGLSLSCAVSGLLGSSMATTWVSYASLGALGVPTLLCGLAWAALLRVKRPIGKTSIRWSFLGSIPLASLNGGIAYVLLHRVFASPYAPPLDASDVYRLFRTGATEGGVLFPALLLTLVFFGLPIWRSHRLARNGLAGEEQGERNVGIASMFVAALGLVTASQIGFASTPLSVVLERVGCIFELAMGVGGLALGFSAVLFSILRARRRRAFVDAAANGDVQGFRVSETPEGRVLVRITSMGQGYRVADFEEPLATVDDAWESTARLTG